MKPDKEDIDTQRTDYEFVDLEVENRKKVLRSEQKNRYSEGADVYRSWKFESQSETSSQFKFKDKDAFYSPDINIEIDDDRLKNFFKKSEDGIREAAQRQKYYNSLFDNN